MDKRKRIEVVLLPPACNTFDLDPTACTQRSRPSCCSCAITTWLHVSAPLGLSSVLRGGPVGPDLRIDWRMNHGSMRGAGGQPLQDKRGRRVRHRRLHPGAHAGAQGRGGRLRARGDAGGEARPRGLQPRAVHRVHRPGGAQGAQISLTGACRRHVHLTAHVQVAAHAQCMLLLGYTV